MNYKSRSRAALVKVLKEEEGLRLVQELLKLTHENALKWSVSKDNEWLFIVSTPRFVFNLDSTDRDDYPPYRLRIWRIEDKKLVDTLGTDINNSLPSSSQLNEQLERLYEAVARKTRMLDHVADDILSDLRSLEEPF